MDYEEEIKGMLETLATTPECGYIKNFVRRETLRTGKVVKVLLFVEIEKDDLME